MEQRSRLNIASLFLLQITKQWPPPLSQIYYTQAIWLEMWRWPLFVWTREKGESKGGGDQSREKGDNHQVHSMPICRLVNGAHSAGVQSSGYANSESQPAVEGEPSNWFSLREGIKAGIEEWAPSLCALVSPKTNASSFLMEALWRWSTLRNRWTDGDGDSHWATCNTCTFLVFLDNKLMINSRFPITCHWIWHKGDIKCKARIASDSIYSSMDNFELVLQTPSIHIHGPLIPSKNSAQRMDSFWLGQHQLLSFAVRCCLKRWLNKTNRCNGQTAPFLLFSCADVRNLHCLHILVAAQIKIVQMGPESNKIFLFREKQSDLFILNYWHYFLLLPRVTVSFRACKRRDFHKPIRSRSFQSTKTALW